MCFDVLKFWRFDVFLRGFVAKWLRGSTQIPRPRGERRKFQTVQAYSSWIFFVIEFFKVPLCFPASRRLAREMRRHDDECGDIARIWAIRGHPG